MPQPASLDAPVNATMRRFGYPDSTLAETAHWAVLVRPQQATLGALVLACRDPAETLSRISAGAFAELKPLTGQIERCLKSAFAYDKINYLALMMVDPDVHFHVLPRYAAARRCAGVDFVDPGWPGAPQLAHVPQLPAGALAQVTAELRRHWPAA